ncbi:hypothetical protein [Ructibacterium gallinarum]|uniref:Uncharacterized protein n=1 Tax=Ructibacterium gallinarum TaxID=2779355 RepID=A0A9D5RBI5_9FIRM|nr:hypothetical protein [Ructibacterium gallinarum]MBE5040063.1 hypothetical protein [Ructibacterium gallinarum]
MGKEDAWKEFERTGTIGAYMKYRSAAKAASGGNDATEKKENTPQEAAQSGLRGAAEERRMGLGNHRSPGDYHPGG